MHAAVLTASLLQHTCPRVKIKGGGNFWSSEGGEGDTRVPGGDLLNKIWIKGVEQFPKGGVQSRSPKAQGGAKCSYVLILIYPRWWCCNFKCKC